MYDINDFWLVALVLAILVVMVSRIAYLLKIHRTINSEAYLAVEIVCGVMGTLALIFGVGLHFLVLEWGFLAIPFALGWIVWPLLNMVFLTTPSYAQVETPKIPKRNPE